jgi:hypothetical protein
MEAWANASVEDVIEQCAGSVCRRVHSWKCDIPACEVKHDSARTKSLEINPCGLAIRDEGAWVTK